MRAVFFDLDGTLVELPDDFEAVFEAALSDAGVSPDPEYHDHFVEILFEHLDDCHPEPYRAAMADLCAEFDIVPDFEELAAAYVDREVGATELAAGAREALDALDCQLGVVTNGATGVQRPKLAHHDLEEYFDAVVVSGDVGASKPDPEIFAAARESIPADEYAFVADDLERDVVPAQGAGFTGVHLVDGDASADRDGRADATVASLGEVPDVLE
ncbi:HAD family hydrolase [Halorussus salilacus]|uniref:HAD family hydrolase n=1 Tax=Halorussus salilacus TaxID=2953750 RepID=UPI00209F5883|nr:HAD family hydrolase [Halorussus salilacus]USZ69066.1 HAD family hydrolase [Halorussus salilacus]